LRVWVFDVTQTRTPRRIAGEIGGTLQVIVLMVVAALVGVSGAFMHHWARPLGIFLAIGAVVGVMYIGRRWLRSRAGLGAVALAWVAPILVFAAERPEGDLVIQADAPGLVLIFGGVAALGVSLGMGTTTGKLRRFA
jgi:hypothetical protein